MFFSFSYMPEIKIKSCCSAQPWPVIPKAASGMAAPPLLALWVPPRPSSVLTCSLFTVELQQKDRALVELLQEKVGLFAEMTHFQVEENGSCGMPLPTLPRGLFRSESLESPRGERLLQDAIREGEGTPREESRLVHSLSQTVDTQLDPDACRQKGCPPHSP